MSYSMSMRFFTTIGTQLAQCPLCRRNEDEDEDEDEEESACFPTFFNPWTERHYHGTISAAHILVHMYVHTYELSVQYVMCIGARQGT